MGDIEITPGLKVHVVTDEELAEASPTYREHLARRLIAPPGGIEYNRVIKGSGRQAQRIGPQWPRYEPTLFERYLDGFRRVGTRLAFPVEAEAKHQWRAAQQAWIEEQLR